MGREGPSSSARQVTATFATSAQTLGDLSRLKGHRFPRTVIGYAIGMYHRFALSLHDVEDLLAERGVVVSHETIRVWVAKFRAQIVAKMRREG